jgi:hypothetical protein
MNRYTFVIKVHANGPSTLENLTTHELISLPDLDAAGNQIERWLRALRDAESQVRNRSSRCDEVSPST